MATGQKTGGRKKGTPNKLTVSVKEALSDAFESLGGVGSLVQWGRENPDDFYKLWVKMLPTEVKAELTGVDGGAIVTRVERVIIDAAKDQ
jgi:hypothetical protein